MLETKYPHYFVNELGEVYSDKSGILKKMSLQKSSSGYLCVRLYLHGEKWKTVHRLVMETYFPNVKHKQVNHKDGVKTNNRLENLEWVTGKENIIHAHAIGLTPIGEKHSRA